MDSDLWISRLAAAKRQFSLQHRQHGSHTDRVSVDEYEVEEELRQDFTCPYCYEEHDIASLCCHLEDEHAYESRVSVCPICSAKISRDMLNHITLQHGQLFKISFIFIQLVILHTIFLAVNFITMIQYVCVFSLMSAYLQRHRRLRRVAIPNSQALALLGRDLREAHLQVLLGSGAYRSSGNNHVPAVAPDSLLSSLVLNFPSSEPEEIPKPTISVADEPPKKSHAPSNVWKPSIDSSLSQEEKERKMQQAAVRAVFVQDLLRSTLFGD